MSGVYVRIDLSEVHALADAFRRHADEAPAKARQIVQKGGNDILADMQRRTPVDTGALRASESLDETHEGLGFVAGPTMDYGDYVERGTSRMSAQPYAGPAFDRGLPRIERGLQALPSLGFRR